MRHILVGSLLALPLLSWADNVSPDGSQRDLWSRQVPCFAKVSLGDQAWILNVRQVDRIEDHQFFFKDGSSLSWPSQSRLWNAQALNQSLQRQCRTLPEHHADVPNSWLQWDDSHVINLNALNFVEWGTQSVSSLLPFFKNPQITLSYGVNPSSSKKISLNGDRNTLNLFWKALLPYQGWINTSWADYAAREASRPRCSTPCIQAGKPTLSDSIQYGAWVYTSYANDPQKADHVRHDWLNLSSTLAFKAHESGSSRAGWMEATVMYGSRPVKLSLPQSIAKAWEDGTKGVSPRIHTLMNPPVSIEAQGQWKRPWEDRLSHWRNSQYSFIPSSVAFQQPWIGIEYQRDWRLSLVDPTLLNDRTSEDGSSITYFNRLDSSKLPLNITEVRREIEGMNQAFNSQSRLVTQRMTWNPR